MAPRSPAALVAVALAALSSAAALGLSRVFATERYVLPVLGAVVVVHLLGALARVRGMAVLDVLSIWVAALAIYLVWALVPGTTRFGLPTLDTFDTLAQDLGNGFDELRNAIVPAAVTDGAVLLAVLAVWLMAAAAELLAFWRRAPIAALAPALALFIWTAALGTDTSATLSTLAFAAASLAFLLLAQQAALVSGRARFAGRNLGAGTGLVGVGALLGTVALIGGLIVGNAFPGADAAPLLDLRGLGREGDRPDSRSYRTDPPLARIGEDLTREEAIGVFTVTSQLKEYWRIAALDRYESTNGGEWTLAAAGSDEVQEGLSGNAAGAIRQRYEIDRLEGRWMPAMYEPVRVEGGAPLVVKSSRTLVSGRLELRNLEYTVNSRLPPANAAAATDAQRSATDRPVPAGLQQYLELPGDFPGEVVARAREVTDGAATPYDRAAALERFFLDPEQRFEYSLEPELLHDNQSQSAIAEFLQERRGFCVQFAGSFAAMARAVGLPARVAVGFTSGTADGTEPDLYRVTSHEAHAWPEVYLGGLGWTRFEPTPASDDAGGADLPGREPVAPSAETPALTPGESQTPSTEPDAGAAPTTAAPRDPGADVTIDTEDPDGGGGGLLPGWELLVGLAAAIILAAVGVAVGIVLAKSRRRQSRRARPEPAASIAGAWEEVLDRLGEAGIKPDRARTPLELSRAAPRRHLPSRAAAPLAQLARLYSAARYGRSAPSGDAARDAWDRAGAVTSALSEEATLTERWRRRLDPTPLRR